MSISSAPGPQQKRFAAYLEGLAKAAGHADRIDPLKSYCKGLLLPLERKSVEPMAAKLAPDNVQRMHQSLHHLVAHAPWSDEALLQQVRQSVLPQMEQNGPVIARIVDDTGFLKKGTHSVGVARQYCGQIGKQDNCQVAVSLSITTAHASLPIGWRLSEILLRVCFDFWHAIEDGAFEIEFHHHAQSLRKSRVHPYREIQSADFAIFDQPGEGWQGLAKLVAGILLRVVTLFHRAEDFFHFWVVIEE